MNLQKLTIYLLIVTLIAPTAIAKQRTEPPEVWREYANKLEAGVFVRVTLKNHKKIDGHFVMIESDALRLKPKTRLPAPLRDFEFTDIESIDRHKEGWSPGRKVTTGIAIAVVSGILAALIGAVVTD